MKSVDLWKEPDGLWCARIYSTVYSGTYEQCVAWLRANGEDV